LLLLILLLLVGDTLQSCSDPQAEEGHKVTEGCLQSICKSGVWRSSLVNNMCCYDGQVYAINTTISSSISENGCAKASIDCVKETSGNARMVLRIKNYCEDSANKLEEREEMLLEHKEAGSGCQKESVNSKDEKKDTKVLWTGPGMKSGGKSEVLTLPDLTPLDCNLPVFPEGDYESYTVRYTSEGIHMCGGVAGDYYSGDGPSSSCYLLTTTGYQDMPGLLNKRSGAASVETTLGWWVTGGFDGEKMLATTELWSNNKWQEHVRLPEPMYGHCMTKINESHILIVGGENKWSKNAFLYSEETGFTKLGDLKTGRSYQGCSLVNDNMVFVAGGYEAVTGSHLVTEYLNLTTLTWMAGPNLHTKPDVNYSGGALSQLAEMLGPADMIGSLLISAGQIFKLEQLGLSDVQQWQWVEAGDLKTSMGWFRSLAISAKFCL